MSTLVRDVGTAVGPTGVLVWAGDPTTDRAEWLAERRKGIGSSDVPPIMGVVDYATAIDVWGSKTGRIPDNDQPSEAALWGHLLERPVANEWARRNHVYLSRLGIVAHRDHDWMRASLDRLVHDCPRGDCSLEVKTRSAWVAGRWRDDVPDDVLAQVQWDLAITGHDHAHVACLIGGQELREYTIHPEPELQDFLVDHARDVWQAVQEDVRPVIDPETATARVTEALDRLTAQLDGSIDVDPDIAERLLAEYVTAREDEKAAAKRKKDAGAGLAVLADGHETVRVRGLVAYTRRRSTYTHIDTELLREKWPDIYDEVAEDRQKAPALHISKEYQA